MTEMIELCSRDLGKNTLYESQDPKRNHETNNQHHMVS